MKIKIRDDLLSILTKRIEKYRKKSKKAWEIIENKKDFSGSGKRKFPISELEEGPVTEKSLVPWSVFCGIVSQREFQRLSKEGVEIPFREGKTKVNDLLKLFPKKNKHQSKR